MTRRSKPRREENLMVRKGIVITRGVVAILMLTGIPMSAWGQGKGAVAPPFGFGGDMKDMTFIRGNIVCAGCTLDEARKAHKDRHSLYELEYKDGRVVVDVNWVDDAPRWDSIVGPSRRLWVRAEDKVLRKLTAEENLFKEVEISGVLRSTRTFDIADVTIKG
jgi:hypothetical protein